MFQFMKVWQCSLLDIRFVVVLLFMRMVSVRHKETRNKIKTAKRKKNREKKTKRNNKKTKMIINKKGRKRGRLTSRFLQAL
jgi:biopolymer transport protein ExbD